MQDRIRQYHKFKKEFQQQHNFEPDETEIMKALNIKKKTLHDLEQIIYESKCSSLDNSIFDDGGSLLDSVCGSSNMEDDIVDELTRQQLNCELWEQVKSLDDRQSMVIYEHYHDSKPLKEISDTLHLSQERTSQIKDAALEQLRKLGKIREIAEAFNYDSSAAFHGGISKFKEFGSSTVEYLALKHIEQEEKERTASDLFNQILQMV
jgi:DNA-directed RNA polymerase specialized sigma subunit